MQDGEQRAPQRWLGLAVAVAVVSLSIALQLRLMDRAAIPMDEGHLATAAVRVLDGELLYRDVHTGIAPVIYHVAAALFAVFGEDLIVTRAAQVAVNAAVALLLWLLASRVARRHWAALAPLLYLMWVALSFPVLSMLNYSALALALSLGALLCAQRYQQTGRTGDALATGCLLAGAALTKQNYGALAILAIAISLVWNYRGSKLAEVSIARAIAPIVACGSAIALAVVAYFAARGGFLDFVHSTLLDLGGSQLQSFDNPMPPIFGAHPSDDPLFIFLYTPPTLFNSILRGDTWFGHPLSTFARELAVRLSYGVPLATLAGGAVSLFFSGEQRDSRVGREVRSLVVFACVFFLGIFPSAIWSHLAFVVAPTLLVAVVLLDRFEGAIAARWNGAGAASQVAATLALVLCAVVSLSIGSAVQSWHPEALELARGRVHVTPHYAALYRGANRFVEDCAAPGEAIFVAPDIPIVYFLTGRRNSTPYDLTIPGNVDAAVIVASLERDRTRCIVYNPRMYPEFPPFAELFPQLDRYLNEHYQRTAVIAGRDGEWHGLTRRTRESDEDENAW